MKEINVDNVCSHLISKPRTDAYNNDNAFFRSRVEGDCQVVNRFYLCQKCFEKQEDEGLDIIEFFSLNEY